MLCATEWMIWRMKVFRSLIIGPVGRTRDAIEIVAKITVLAQKPGPSAQVKSTSQERRPLMIECICLTAVAEMEARASVVRGEGRRGRKAEGVAPQSEMSTESPDEGGPNTGKATYDSRLKLREGAGESHLKLAIEKSSSKQKREGEASKRGKKSITYEERNTNVQRPRCWKE
ncbi:hypothetical protein BOTBODRAFT_207919 [Botryobasidium botryosum FD-172 SS1]|uniref:Uncharacterized protein n=1 Tax=Botryobasidium botryosum (strain FD-172 SS1) TaxID=930990 RepID=A0A067N3N1_BOTB1|nr:hypothetical protein BOTBODRAFT_207919 [Botryobasidium botryosum FD-172 SS1]